MRGLALLLILGISFPCAAQKNVLREMTGKGIVKQAFSQNASQVLQNGMQNGVLRNARVVQGKILPGSKKKVISYNKDLDKYIFSRVQPTPVQSLPILMIKPSSMQWAEANLTYLRVMESFKKFKKEMDVLLYYQSKPSERRTISNAERAVYVKKISKIQEELAKLKHLISPDDPAYKAAREYVIYAAETVNPMMRGVLRDRVHKRTDRVLNEDEFFLHEPEGKDWAELSQAPMIDQLRQVASQLPPNLKIAVLNDREEMLAKMQALNQAGLFVPTWKIKTYTNAENLINAVTRGQESFDLILSDIIVPGGGGFYLTGVLRDKGFKGIIIALSSYGEDSSVAKAMFDKGFDGMISKPIGFENQGKWPLQIMQNLAHYFYYRDLHHWMR